MAYRILALDGGGMRGLITVLMLERLQSEVPDLLPRIDLVAGTSTGGLIALGIAAGLPLGGIRRLYEQEGPRIFADSPFDDLADLGRLVGADYASSGLEAVLRELFGDRTLADLKKRILLPTFDLDSGDDSRHGGPSSSRRRWKAKIMHNFPGIDSDGEVPAWRAGMRTSAAPIYFPSSDGFIDGAVVAANPAVCAVAQTQDRRSFDMPPGLGEIRLLSLGCGEVAQFLPGERHDWGVLQWGKPLVDIVMSGTVDVATYQCRSFLGERFWRLSPQLERQDRLQLDSHSPWALQRMRQIAARIPIEGAVSWLERFW
ncbi:MAG: patatin-like phospholipase family protein [Trueperaceae bacterium]